MFVFYISPRKLVGLCRVYRVTLYKLSTKRPLAGPRTAKQDDETSITHSSFNCLAAPNVGK